MFKKRDSKLWARLIKEAEIDDDFFRDVYDTLPVPKRFLSSEFEGICIASVLQGEIIDIRVEREGVLSKANIGGIHGYKTCDNGETAPDYCVWVKNCTAYFKNSDDNKTYTSH